jgi:predicted CoA-binding protein
VEEESEVAMPDRKTIEEFLRARNVAFVGVSRDQRQFANAVYRRLRDGGRTLYPVNASADHSPIEGDPSYTSLTEVPDPLDGVIVMVPAGQAADVVQAAVRRGVRRVWLHRGVGRGSVTEEAVRLCREADIDVVDGACPLMFEDPVRGIHRLHGLLAGRKVAA